MAPMTHVQTLRWLADEAERLALTDDEIVTVSSQTANIHVTVDGWERLVKAGLVRDVRFDLFGANKHVYATTTPGGVPVVCVFPA